MVICGMSKMESTNSFDMKACFIPSRFTDVKAYVCVTAVNASYRNNYIPKHKTLNQGCQHMRKNMRKCKQLTSSFPVYSDFILRCRIIQHHLVRQKEETNIIRPSNVEVVAPEVVNAAPV